jgi:hypothetical protein
VSVSGFSVKTILHTVLRNKCSFSNGIVNLADTWHLRRGYQKSFAARTVEKRLNPDGTESLPRKDGIFRAYAKRGRPNFSDLLEYASGTDQKVLTPPLLEEALIPTAP